MDQELTLDLAVKNVEQVFSTVQADLKTHLALQASLKLIKEKLPLADKTGLIQVK